MKPFYLTTTLPYVNGAPHVGHCIEFMRADMLVRDKQMRGVETFFNTGTDEHGQKIADKAVELRTTPQAYVDEMSQGWVEFCKTIGMEYDFFSRTTNPDHEAIAQELWKKCDANGYIYKKSYQAKYCVGCELEKTDSELIDGVCPDHPGKELELIDEENYFFAFSKFQDRLLELYKNNPTFVVPDFRLTEIRNFVEGGLQDFSISRLKEKMSWGVPVPGDDNQVMYVWFDALANYISCLGWSTEDQSQYEKFWKEGETLQICGKDNLRQQSAIWQAMLMAAELPNTNQIFVEGHVVSGGVKMSKSIGNVIDPVAYIDYYGVDAVRYFVARGVHDVQDSDWTVERFHESYMASLVNGLGNLVNRVLNMADSYGVSLETKPNIDLNDNLKNFKFNTEMDRIWKMISDADQYITDEAPFKKAKTDMSAAQEDLRYLLEQLWMINQYIAPFMPETHAKITEAIKANKKPSEPLFPRLDFKSDI